MLAVSNLRYTLLNWLNLCSCELTFALKRQKTSVACVLEKRESVHPGKISTTREVSFIVSFPNLCARYNQGGLY